MWAGTSSIYSLELPGTPLFATPVPLLFSNDTILADALTFILDSPFFLKRSRDGQFGAGTTSGAAREPARHRAEKGGVWPAAVLKQRLDLTQHSFDARSK